MKGQEFKVPLYLHSSSCGVSLRALDPMAVAYAESLLKACSPSEIRAIPIITPILARSSQQQPGSDLPRGYLAACRSSVPGAGLQPYVYSLHNKKFSDVLSCHTLPTPSLFLTALSSPLPPTPNGASGMPRYSFNQRPAQHGPMRTCTNTHVNQSRTQKYRKPAIEYSHDRKHRHSLVFLL